MAAHGGWWRIAAVSRRRSPRRACSAACALGGRRARLRRAAATGTAPDTDERERKQRGRDQRNETPWARPWPRAQVPVFWRPHRSHSNSDIPLELDLAYWRKVYRSYPSPDPSPTRGGERRL